LISKLCRESAVGKFIVVVPRRAKSAATLICCGADEIHMGQMSELGPIDPQIDYLPALGLKNAIQHLAELASQYPTASEMFAKYLSESLNLEHLGYYERVVKSAVQYAERLLRKRIVHLKGDYRETSIQR
jgi:membrane-bound ClpP family serine protease